MNYTEPRPSARRPFVVTHYRPDADGILCPILPDRCPYAPPDEPCHIVIDHRRARKTGPCYPLTVATCSVHGHAFTLYPPGHVPYGRSAIAPVSHDGALILDDRPVQDQGGNWQDTLFKAAIDAARGTAWVREAEHGSNTWWSTQVRRITWALALLALGPLPTDHRHKAARILDVDTLALLEQERAIDSAPGYRSRGRAVELTLSELDGPRLLERLLIAGHLAGLWGPPHVWDPDRRVLRRLAPSGTDPPWSDRGIRSTTSERG